MANTSSEKKFWDRFADDKIRFMHIMETRFNRENWEGSLRSSVKTEAVISLPSPYAFDVEYYDREYSRRNTRRKLRPGGALRERFIVNDDQKQAYEEWEYQQKKYEAEIDLSCSEIDFERSSFGNVVYKWETRDDNISFYDWYPDYEEIDGVKVAKCNATEEEIETYNKQVEDLFLLEQYYEKYMRYANTPAQIFEDAVFGNQPIMTQDEYIADCCKRLSPSHDMDYNDFLHMFSEGIKQYVKERHHMYSKTDENGNPLTHVKYETAMGPLDQIRYRDGNLNPFWVKYISLGHRSWAVETLKAVRAVPLRVDMYTNPKWVPFKRPFYDDEGLYPVSMDFVKKFLYLRFGSLPKWDGSEQDLPPIKEREPSIYKIPVPYEPPSIENPIEDYTIDWDEMFYFFKVDAQWLGYGKDRVYPLVKPLKDERPGIINAFPGKQGYMMPKSVYTPDYSKYLVPPKWYLEQKKKAIDVDTIQEVSATTTD